MNINLSNYYTDTNIASNSGYGKKDIVEADKNNIQNIDDISVKNLSDLSVGDVFRGEIINVNNQKIEILLDNNECIDASMQQAFELNIGEKLFFQVKDKNEVQLVIKPIANNSVSSELVNKSLLAAGLTLNDKNIVIVKELIGNGQPIDKHSIINMIKLTSLYKNEPIDKLIDMMKNGIEINDENMAMYDLYSESRHYVTDSLTEIGKGITKLTERFSENYKILDDLSKLFDNSENDVFVNENMENDSIPDSKILFEPDYEVSNGIITGEKKINGHIDSVAVNTEDFIEKDNLNNDLSYDLKQFDSMLSETTSFKDLSIIIKNLHKNLKSNEFNELIKKSAIKDKIIKLLIEGVALKTDRLNDDKYNIKTEVIKIYNKLEKLTELIKNMPESVRNENLSEAGEKLHKNMNFMNELNNIESYVQIPVHFSEGQKNADLYVYNRKKNRNINDEKLTAFLHLQLDYLGATDVNISMTRNKVTTKFTLDNEISMKLVEENIDILKERIEKMGYNVQISTEVCKKNLEEFNAILPITENNQNAVSIKRYTFDIRT